MSRKYDPNHIFNDKRTKVQQNGMTKRVKLIEDVPERIDSNLLEKYYKIIRQYHYFDPKEIHISIDSLFTFARDLFIKAGSTINPIIPRPVHVDLNVQGIITLQEDMYAAAGSTITAVCPINQPIIINVTDPIDETIEDDVTSDPELSTNYPFTFIYKQSGINFNCYDGKMEDVQVVYDRVIPQGITTGMVIEFGFEDTPGQSTKQWKSFSYSTYSTWPSSVSYKIGPSIEGYQNQITVYLTIKTWTGSSYYTDGPSPISFTFRPGQASRLSIPPDSLVGVRQRITTPGIQYTTISIQYKTHYYTVVT